VAKLTGVGFVASRNRTFCMTPQDVPGPVIAMQTLAPWLAAIVPPAEPVWTITPAATRHTPGDALRPAA